mmetsp:Transcript_4421/g.5649  ORF Transcript_4421/g.5649 Transcript_4421/m.5649 type:complete len:82 (-) Transcript_4421:128-373(-)
MKDVAEMVKLAFDDKYIRKKLHFVKKKETVLIMISTFSFFRYPGAWHVIVGKSFGSFVTHEVSSIIYFFVGSVGFLIFKHG